MKSATDLQGVLPRRRGPVEMSIGRGGEEGIHSDLISEDGKAVTSINKVTFMPHKSFAEAPALDVLWVPGGDPKVLETMMRDPNGPYFQYLRQVAANAKWVCSVCEGALLLARAGLLDGHAATTHWYFVESAEVQEHRCRHHEQAIPCVY